MDEVKEKLIEPLKYYYGEIKDNFKQQVSDFFDELVKQSGIDIEVNKKISKEYDELFSEKEKINKKFKLFKTLGILILIIGIAFFVIAAFLAFSNRNYFTKNIMIKILVFLLIGTLFLVLKYALISKKTQSIEKLLDDAKEKCQQKLYECYNSMSGLNKLMDSKYTFELINKNIPFIKLDSYFNKKRYEELYYIYGLGNNSNKNYSTLEAVSGNILGNPFVLLKELKHRIVQHTYKGTLNISWTESYTDSDGKVKTRTKHETLRATIEKPRPEYSEPVSLILANEVADNLSFYRAPSHIEKLSDNALKKKINKEEKNLRKLEEKSIKTNSSFVAMSNIEFEALFNALDRTNETEFRLLFTPLAQQNMVELLKNKEYGDNFYFIKNNKINTIVAEHTKNWDLDCNVDKFKTYSYEKCKDFFIKFNTEYFNNFFFAMAPLISIPLYQQYMAGNYIYDTEFEYNYNPYTSEILANALDKKNFIHPKTKTSAILKANHISTKGDTDLVKISAYSYDIIPRVEYVSVKGGDGYYHDVPVEWEEFIDLSKETSIELKRLDINDNKFEEIRNSNNSDDIFSNRETYAYKNRIFATLSDSKNIKSEDLFNTLLVNLN